MYYLTLIVVIIGFLLTGCAPSDGMHHGMEHGSEFSVESTTGTGEIAFVIRKDGAVLNDYAVNHTKEMHLIVVRDDLTHFSHLHPTRDAQGVWHVAFAPKDGGTYWMYADFADGQGTPSVERFSYTYPGDFGPYGTEIDETATRDVDGLTVKFTPDLSGKQGIMRFAVTNAAGRTPELQPYLGAPGHAIVLTKQGDYLHAHPHGDGLEFETTLPAEGVLYRTFLEFQTDDRVHVASFDLVGRSR
jgi:hypothetical protein